MVGLLAVAWSAPKHDGVSGPRKYARNFSGGKLKLFIWLTLIQSVREISAEENSRCSSG